MMRTARRSISDQPAPLRNTDCSTAFEGQPCHAYNAQAQRPRWEHREHTARCSLKLGVVPHDMGSPCYLRDQGVGGLDPDSIVKRDERVWNLAFPR